MFYLVNVHEFGITDVSSALISGVPLYDRDVARRSLPNLETVRINWTTYGAADVATSGSFFQINTRVLRLVSGVAVVPLSLSLSERRQYPRAVTAGTCSGASRP